MEKFIVNLQKLPMDPVSAIKIVNHPVYKLLVGTHDWRYFSIDYVSVLCQRYEESKFGTALCEGDTYSEQFHTQCGTAPNKSEKSKFTALVSFTVF